MKPLTDLTSTPRQLRTILSMAFFLLVAGVLLLYASVETFSDFKIQETLISNRQQSIAQNAAMSVRNFIDENFEILEAAVWLTNLGAAPREEQARILQSLLGFRSAFRQLALLDAGLRMMDQSSLLSMEASKRFTDRLLDFLSHQQGQNNRRISSVYIDPLTNEPMVMAAVSVTDVFGDFKGTLIGELNLKSMWDIVGKIKVGETGYAYVSDKKGNLLAFQDIDRVLKGENVSYVRAVSDFIQDQDPSVSNKIIRYAGIRGSTVVGAYTAMQNPDWAVFIELSWKETYSAIFQHIKSAAVIMLSLAILAAFFGMFMAKRLAMPIITLTDTATRITEDKKNLQAKVTGPREVAHLAMAFNRMTSQLRKSMKALKQRYSDLKRTEEALRLSEERLRLALEGTSDGIWDWNVQTGEIYLSHRYYTMLGYEQSDVTSDYENWRQLIHPDDQESLGKALQGLLEEKSQISIEYRFKAKNGEWHWILSRGKVVESQENGNVVRVAGTHADITQRKQTEETLRKYERIVSTTQDLMALINTDYIYEAVNDSFMKSFDLRREAIVGRTVADVVGVGAFREKIQPWLDRALSGQIVRYRETFDTTSNESRIMDTTNFPMMDKNGRVEGVVLNVRDVTETCRLEEQLIQSQKIESLGTLAGGVAHEINNPINVIMNYAQMIVDRTDNENPSVNLAFKIMHETQRVAIIVRNLLTFARYEKQSPRPTNLADIVSSVLSLIQTVIRHDQIEIQVDVPENLPEINCRSQQIQQVLMNLMTNARDALNERYPDYSPEKQIRVYARLVETENGSYIRTTVEDKGIGISRQVFSRIFDPFFTTKPKEMGTGLGLSISYAIARDHAGDLSVESEPEQYTRFHMDLPLKNG